ncbi:hypothetical protein BBO_03258 [Beauveria brongniartii RCEF 3172]|uniref:Uncharacterized protein n=1 Tax=Beauveria brongniartii RCEF 3172 TaxID=1081107 RepID=A0A162JSM9_9HYPO|nr:hypothetical protein BBO_03258 [Beauveria brongniartii RCEF 3172]
MPPRLLNRSIHAGGRILSRCPYKLGMLRQRHWRHLSVHPNLVDAHRDKRQAPANLFRRRRHLELVTNRSRAEEAEVHVGAGAGGVAQVPRGNGHARRHVDNGGGDGAVQAPAAVDVHGVEQQPADDAALRDAVQGQCRQDGAVDGAAALEGREDGRDVSGSHEI